MTKTLLKRYKEHPEIAEKIGKAHRGKKRPPETGKKISIVKLGHEVSEEQRIKQARTSSKNFYNLENLLTKEKYNDLSRYEVFKIVKIPHIDLYASGQRGKIKYTYGNFRITLSK